MQNKTLQNEFEKGLPGTLYYLWSGEDCFLEDARSRFVETVIASSPIDFNYDTFDSTSEPQEVIDAACTLPVMARRRLVVLKEFDQLAASAIKVMKHYLNDPAESTCLLILSRKAPKASLKYKWKVFSLNMKEWDIPAWLRNSAARKGVKLTNEAVDYLIEFVGYDTGLLMMEIEKLALAGSGTVSGKDILSSTTAMRQYTSFDLINALIAGQKAKSFRILKGMLSGNAFDAPVILGTLNWHFRQFYSLWFYKGKRPGKMREKTYRALIKHLPSVDEDYFCRIFQNLHEADLGVKTTGRPELVLETLLIRLLQKGAWN